MIVIPIHKLCMEYRVFEYCQNLKDFISYGKNSEKSNVGSEYRFDLDYETKESTFTSSINCIDTNHISLIIAGAVVFIMPIYYLYLWIVVKSHRENLVRQQSVIQPISQRHQQQVFVMSNGMLKPQQQGSYDPIRHNLYYQPPTTTQQYSPETNYYRL